MTYLDNEILTNAKRIHMAFRELLGHNTSCKLMGVGKGEATGARAPLVFSNCWAE